jgi:hypothetical protein
LVASTLLVLFSEMLEFSQNIFFKEKIMYTTMTHHSYPSRGKARQKCRII